MNIFAVVVLFAAIGVGLAAHFGVQRKWATVALSLVLFALAFGLQSVMHWGFVWTIG